MLGTRIKAKRRSSARVMDATINWIQAASADGYRVSQDRVPVAFGELKRSGVPPYEEADGDFTWGYKAPHAPHVEFGTAPHWAPIEPLKRWAALILGDESAAYAVQQKIAKYGTPPQPFVRPGLAETRRVLKATGQNLKADMARRFR